MPALVLGGAGFIGSHLVDELLVQGMEVLVVDDLSSGSFDNLRRWKGCPRLDFVRADARDAGLLARACDHKGWIFCFLVDPPLSLGLASHRAGAKRLVANCNRQLLDVPPGLSACGLSYDREAIYGPRGPREGRLFISDIVRANVLAAMNRDVIECVRLDHMGSQALGWWPQVDPAAGQAIIEAYERANPTSLIVTR